MYFCLFVAIVCTLIWINTLHADSINSKLNPYSSSDSKDEDKKRAQFKTYLVIIIAMFSAAIIRFI